MLRLDVSTTRVLPAETTWSLCDLSDLPQCRCLGHETPLPGGSDVEYIRHRPLGCSVQIHVLCAEDIFDRAQRIDLAVVCADHRALLHVRSDDVRRGAMRIHMIGAILAIIFGDDDQCIRSISARRNGLYEATDCEVVIRLLRFWSVDVTERRTKTAHMVMAHTYERKARQVSVGNELIELALPFVVAPQVRIVL